MFERVVYQRIVDKFFTCTFLLVVILEVMYSDHTLFLRFLQKFMKEEVWSMHICKYFCLILNPQHVLGKFDVKFHAVAMVLNYKVL